MFGVLADRPRLTFTFTCRKPTNVSTDVFPRFYFAPNKETARPDTLVNENSRSLTDNHRPNTWFLLFFSILAKKPFFSGSFFFSLFSRLRFWLERVGVSYCRGCSFVSLDSVHLTPSTSSSTSIHLSFSHTHTHAPTHTHADYTSSQLKNVCPANNGCVRL